MHRHKFIAAIFSTGLVVIHLSIIWGCTHALESEWMDVPSVGRIDLSMVPDGTFRGGYRIEEFNYEVDVTVELHQIKGIRIIKAKQRVFEKKCALCEVNVMIRDILELQTLDVDAISGATQTSQAVLKAIEDALQSPYQDSSDG